MTSLCFHNIQRINDTMNRSRMMPSLRISLHYGVVQIVILIIIYQVSGHSGLTVGASSK